MRYIVVLLLAFVTISTCRAESVKEQRAKMVYVGEVTAQDLKKATDAIADLQGKLSHPRLTKEQRHQINLEIETWQGLADKNYQMFCEATWYIFAIDYPDFAVGTPGHKAMLEYFEWNKVAADVCRLDPYKGWRDAAAILRPRLKR